MRKKSTWIVGVLLVIAGVAIMGALFFYKPSMSQRDFVETPQLYQKLNQEKSKKFVLVFFKNGCPYCRSAKDEIASAIKQSDIPVYIVNTESKTGKDLVNHFRIKYASTITVLDSGKFKSLPYADKIDGKIKPIKSNIKQALEE